MRAPKASGLSKKSGDGAAKFFSDSADFLRFMRLAILLLGATAIFLATVQGVPIDRAVGVTGFLGAIAIAAVEYMSSKTITLALYRTGKLAYLVITAFLVIFALWKLRNLDAAAAAHSSTVVQGQVSSWINEIKLGFWALLSALVLAACYVFWKFRALRFSESRLGLLKDLMIKLRPLRPEQSATREQYQEGIEACLQALHGMLLLSPYDWLLRRFRLVSRSHCSTRVELFSKVPGENFYQIEAAAYDPDLPQSARKLNEWRKDHHRPTELKEEGYLALVKQAQGIRPKGWRRRYLNFHDRRETISIVGWVVAKLPAEDGPPLLVSKDSSQCLAFDNSAEIELQKLDWVNGKDLRWVRAKSFIACRVQARRPCVILASKNLRGGFVPEDQTPVIALSCIVGDLVDRMDSLGAGTASKTPSRATS